MEQITRFSGLDWFSENHRQIMLIGIGGIGTYTAYNLARIGFPLVIVDPDEIDISNVKGGQLYKSSDINKSKVSAIVNICREFGATGELDPFQEYYSEEIGTCPITICGLDNMKARKEVFEQWEKMINTKKDIVSAPNSYECLFIDGRLTSEAWDVFCIQGNKEEQIREYKEKWLFDDSEVAEMDCTTKQTSFAAMGISCQIVSSLCNWLTNRKLGIDFRTVNFYSRMYLPLFDLKQEEVLELQNS